MMRSLLRFVLGIFQFHKGTIRTFATIAYEIGISNFNSIKVRLEPFN